MRTRGVCALTLALLLGAGVLAAGADDAVPPWPTADQVLDRVRSTLDWYQHARQVMPGVTAAAVVLTAREDEQTVVLVMQRAFEAARAEAALVDQAPAGGATSAAGATPAARRAARRAKLEAAIREGAREVARLRARARAAPPARRAALEREATAAEHRLALDRMRLDFLTSLQQAEAPLASAGTGLVQQIQALQDTVPEAFAPAPAVPAPPPATGTWSVTHRLLALQRARTSLGQLATQTGDLAGAVERDVQRARDASRELSRRLRAAVGAPGADATAPPPEDDFRRELETLKLFGAVLIPLRAESALLQRFEGDMRTWQRTVDRESGRALQELALGFAGVVVGLGAIAVGAIAWRVAVTRYVQDPYRRRLLLRARTIATAAAVVLLLVFHFTSELTALVTALGFATAGIAFALQNVILSMAGYFSMMAPNGIRVGDRVSLQGPFGYVHGEVIEIGLVRLRLRELAADRLEPTGRTVVFPNSVVFTGSFFKHPPPQAQAA